MSRETFLTKEGLQKLKERYDYLINVVKQEVAEKLKTAREYGDLSENAEYDAAKDEQATVEAEIKTIEEQLADFVIIAENDLPSSTVTIGSTVKVFDYNINEEKIYKIVGATEANIFENIISNESPYAQALLGHSAGEDVVVKAPKGKNIKVKILSIQKNQ